MTSKNLSQVLALMRKFTQEMRNLRGEIEMLEMKMIKAQNSWEEVMEAYCEKRDALQKEKKLLSSNKKAAQHTLS